MLQISAHRRFVAHDDGTPFFYLGDTAWELFHRCTGASLETGDRLDLLAAGVEWAAPRL